MTPFASIQILAYILAGLCSPKWLAECSYLSRMDGSTNGPLRYSASSTSVGESNFESTWLPDYEEQIREFGVSVEGDSSTAEPVISDSDFDDASSSDNPVDKKSNSKRDASFKSWDHANKMRILQLHNLYRSNVTPPAGNMAFMEWDTELERRAQMLANNCQHQHVPMENYIGQNLDVSRDHTGYEVIYRWYEERHNYDMRSRECFTDQMCLHYVQMVWAESTKLGCAMAKCRVSYFIVCNYSPGAIGSLMYRVAKPCSQCSVKNAVCLKNLCVTPQQCKYNPFACQEAECNLKCHNCGRLDKDTCTCECADGWDGRDCSELCKNKDKMCEKSPGYPDKFSCSLHTYAANITNTLCRKMCGTCPAMVETSNNTCCGTKLCEEGYVLDPSGKSCRCVLLCPGPLCNEEEDVILNLAAVIGSGAESLRTFPSITIWMVILILVKIYLH